MQAERPARQQQSDQRKGPAGDHHLDSPSALSSPLTANGMIDVLNVKRSPPSASGAAAGQHAECERGCRPLTPIRAEAAAAQRAECERGCRRAWLPDVIGEGRGDEQR